VSNEQLLASLRRAVYSVLATEGRAPSVLELARMCGRTRQDVEEGLRELALRHALVLSPDGDAIRMAHPFSAAPMAFVVSPADGKDDRRWWGGCAWDSFGISAALSLDVLIDTSCPGCGRFLRVHAGPERSPSPALTVRFPVPAARWWDDVVATCSQIRMFCSPEHLADWGAGRPVGQAISATTVWALAQPWYGDRLDPDFRPHDKERNQRLLTEAGLTGEFWRLP
jgi:hypothetical protein